MSCYEEQLKTVTLGISLGIIPCRKTDTSSCIAYKRTYKGIYCDVFGWISTSNAHTQKHYVTCSPEFYTVHNRPHHDAGKGMFVKVWSSLADCWCNTVKVVYSTNLQEPSVDVRKLAGEDEACKRENKSTLT